MIFRVFPESAHPAELERYQGHIKLDDKYPFHGAHGRLTYDLHDKKWIPHIGINNPSNCKADTKNKGYQETMFFGWKIQLEKVQLTRDLKDDTMIYQGIRLEDIEIQQLEHKQQLFGSPKTHVPYFKLQKYTQE